MQTLPSSSSSPSRSRGSAVLHLARGALMEGGVHTQTCPACAKRPATTSCTMGVHPVPWWFFLMGCLAYGPVFFGWLTHVNATRVRVVGSHWDEAYGALAAALLGAALVFPALYLALVSRLARGLFGHVKFSMRVCSRCRKAGRWGGTWLVLVRAMVVLGLSCALFAMPLTFHFPTGLVGLLLIPYALLGRALLRLGVVERRLEGVRMAPEVVSVRVSAGFARVLTSQNAHLLRDPRRAGRMEVALTTGAPALLGVLLLWLLNSSPAMALSCPYGTLPAAWTTSVREVGCMAVDASPHGWWQGRDATGMVVWEGGYWMSKRHGPWQHWRAGRKLSTQHYRRGVLHGTLVSFDKDTGAEIGRIRYEHGKPVKGANQ